MDKILISVVIVLLLAAICRFVDIRRKGNELASRTIVEIAHNIHINGAKIPYTASIIRNGTSIIIDFRIPFRTSLLENARTMLIPEMRHTISYVNQYGRATTLRFRVTSICIDHGVGGSISDISNIHGRIR